MLEANCADYSIYGTQVGQQFVLLITLFTTASIPTTGHYLSTEVGPVHATASCKLLCSCHR